MNNTLCYGGSFNPIHNGHLICARAAAEALGFTKIRIIPSCNPPHKPGHSDLAASDDRVEMSRLAIAGDPFFELDARECARDGPSYTFDTASELRAEGWSRVSWLIGADMLAQLPQWHRAEELIQQVHFVILARPGWQFDFLSLPGSFRLLEANVVQAPLIEISATDIRRRVALGKSIRFLTPDSVSKYILDKGLYRAKPV